MADGNSFRASENALHEKAAARAGSDDFGKDDYLEGLRTVLDAYDEDARFTEMGRKIAEYRLVEALAVRLRSEERLKDLDTSIPGISPDRPVIITGCVRTGSTALHALVGQDPAIQVLEYWMACAPQPRPPRAQWADSPDYRAAEKELELMYAADPSLKRIHNLTTEGPEECGKLLQQCFTDDAFQVSATVPSYNAWYEAANIEPTYRRHRKLLELIGSTRPNTRWVLKYPVHMKNLRALLEVYPDACVVWTHRDPSQVLSSYVSLVASFRALFEDPIDREEIAREQLEIWAGGCEAAIEVRKECDPARFYDLHFRDFIAEPVASVGRFYEHFDVDFSDETQKALDAWVAKNPKGKHGDHRHSMEGLSMKRSDVLDRFSAYMDYFGIEPE